MKKNLPETNINAAKKTAGIMTVTLAVTLVFSFIALAFILMEKNPSDEPAAPVFDLGSTVSTMDALYTYAQMEEDLYIFASRYPEIFRLNTAGQSVDGREIYFVMFGEQTSGKTVMINAGIHGREYLTPLLVMKQLEYYTENFDTPVHDGKTFRELFKGFKFCVVPMINPDGIAISQFGLDGLQNEEVRETVRGILGGNSNDFLLEWKSNAAGVDLNRNFGIAYWQTMQTGRTYPSNQLYKGKAPNSEPETQALINLTQSLKNLVCSVSYHSQGEIVFWDCGQSGKVRADTLRLVDIATGLTGYERQKSFTAPDATYNDWCVLNLGVPSINIETGKQAGTFPLPISQFEKIWNDNCLMWLKIAEEFR